MQTLEWQPAKVPSCALAESPRYAHGAWVWLDITGRKVFKATSLPAANPAEVQSLSLPDEIGCILPTPHPDVWVLLGRQGVYHLHQWQHVQAIAHPPYDAALHRYNDGRADPQGRIWISSLVDARKPATAALYCLEGHTAQAMVGDLIVGNGLAFSPCGQRLMLADTRQRSVWMFEFDAATGQLGERSLMHHYTQGTERPDGACMAADGSYWVAVLEGYRLDRFGPDGQLMDQVELPVAKPTMPCFGGPGLQQLMVTSATPDSQFPNRAGYENSSVIVANTTVRGFPEAFANVN